MLFGFLVSGRSVYVSLSLSDAKASKSGANVEGKLTRKRKTEKLRAEYKVPLTKEKTETELTRRGWNWCRLVESNKVEMTD